MIRPVRGGDPRLRDPRRIRTGALPQVGGIVGRHRRPAAAGPRPVPARRDRTTRADLRATRRPRRRPGRRRIGRGARIAARPRRRPASGRACCRAWTASPAGSLGAAQALLIVWLAGGLLAATGIPRSAGPPPTSTASGRVDQVLPPPTEVVGEIAGALDASRAARRVRGPRARCRSRRSTCPTDPKAAADRRRRGASTARVTSRACDTQVNGTGVRGRPRLRRDQRPRRRRRDARSGSTIGRTTADASAVLFDPTLDIAVLHVPGLDAPALRFATARPRTRRDRRGAGLRGRRLARGRCRPRRGRVRGHRPRHLRQGPGPARDRRAARGDRAGRLGRPAGPRGRHHRRPRVRRVPDRPEVGYALDARSRRDPRSPAIGRTGASTWRCIR